MATTIQDALMDVLTDGQAAEHALEDFLVRYSAKPSNAEKQEMKDILNQTLGVLFAPKVRKSHRMVILQLLKELNDYYED